MVGDRDESGMTSRSKRYGMICEFQGKSCDSINIRSVALFIDKTISLKIISRDFTQGFLTFVVHTRVRHDTDRLGEATPYPKDVSSRIPRASSCSSHHGQEQTNTREQQPPRHRVNSTLRITGVR